MKPENKSIEPRTPEDCLHRMRKAANDFYYQAVCSGNHAFIEFTGLMNEYIKLCEEAHASGRDFMMANIHTNVALPMQDYHAAYVGEKFGCIFFASFAQNPKLAQAFTQGAFPGYTILPVLTFVQDR